MLNALIWRLRLKLDEAKAAVSREEGQGLVEYALIIALVSIAVILLLTLLGNQVGQVFSRITSTLSGS